jgi:alginate O-acetyltransferase complex protein AlgJ
MMRTRPSPRRAPRTSRTPRTSRAALPVWTVVAISLGGLLAHALVPTEIVSGIIREWDGRAGDGTDRRALVDGRPAVAVDAAIEAHHPFREVAVPIIAALRYTILRQGNPGVVVGRDGRLFTREEVEWHGDDSVRLADRVDYIIDVDRRLATAGVDLVVLLVPSKARIDVEHLPLRLRSAADHPRLRRTRDELGREGIRVVEPAEILEGRHFFLRDTHWTPEGAGIAAAAIARALTHRVPSETEFELREQPAQLLVGDLMNFVPLGALNDLLGPGAEVFRPVVAVPVTDESATADLFGTPEIPVALVGTSYSADDRWSFVDQLRRHLGADVLEVSRAGSGPFVPMDAYLRSETFDEIPPRAVIWEIPERYLTLPETPMPPDAAPGDA